MNPLSPLRSAGLEVKTRLTSKGDRITVIFKPNNTKEVPQDTFSTNNQLGDRSIWLGNFSKRVAKDPDSFTRREIGAELKEVVQQGGFEDQNGKLLTNFVVETLETGKFHERNGAYIFGKTFPQGK